jgi:hypothetical protein
VIPLYVVVLNSLTVGEKIAQAVHATAEIHATHHFECASWRKESNTVVVVEMEAEKLEYLAQCWGSASFYEPDRSNELTAVATFETPYNRRLLRRAQLVK